jgi:hypothetical protein
LGPVGYFLVLLGKMGFVYAVARKLRVGNYKEQSDPRLEVIDARKKE